MLYRIAALSVALLGSFTADAAVGNDWDYDHVELWGDLYPDCNGKSNSPIALYSGDCTAPEVDYKFSPGNCSINDYTFDVRNNGVQMSLVENTCENPTVKIPNIAPKYKHLQTHIHLSSEHSIDGGFYGAEMHMVHAQVGSNPAFKAYAVVGTMIQPTATNNNPMFEAWLQKWIEFMNTQACESCWETADIQTYDQNVYQSFVGKDFYHYSGGLTTPGCTEAVAWNFTTEPMAISVRQYQMLTELILDTRVIKGDDKCEDITLASMAGSTSRPPQALNGRSVVKYCSFS